MSEDTISERIGERIASVSPRTYEAAFYLFFLVWLVYLMVTTLSWEWGDKLFPYMIGIPTGVIIVVQLVKVLYPETYEDIMPDTITEDEDSAIMSQLQERFGGALEDELVRDRSQRLGLGATMALWTIGLVVLMWFIGFANALVIWVFAFTVRFFESYRQAAIVTVVFFLGVYIFFIFILGIIPWDGALQVPDILDYLPR